MPLTTPPPNNNNPSKEILASNITTPYYSDLPNSYLQNTGILTTTTTTQSPPLDLITPTGFSTTFFKPTIGSSPYYSLSSGNYFIDDMLIFNDYIHYDKNRTIRFNSELFLQQSLNVFNIYSLRYR